MSNSLLQLIGFRSRLRRLCNPAKQMEVGEVSSAANYDDRLNKLVEELELELNLARQVADAESLTDNESASTTPTNSVEPNSSTVLGTQLRTIEESVDHLVKTVCCLTTSLPKFMMSTRRRSRVAQHVKCEKMLHDVRTDLQHLSEDGRPLFASSNLESHVQMTLSQNILGVDGYLQVISNLDSYINEFMTHSSSEDWDGYTIAQVRRQLDEIWCFFHDRLAGFSRMEQLDLPITEDEISAITPRNSSGSIGLSLQELTTEFEDSKKQLFSSLNFLNDWKYSGARSLLPVFTSELALLRSLISLHALLTNSHEIISSITTQKCNFSEMIGQSSCAFVKPVNRMQLEVNHNENGTPNEEDASIRETMRQLNELVIHLCEEFQPVQDAEPFNMSSQISDRTSTQDVQSSSTALPVLVCLMDNRLINAYSSALTETVTNVRYIPCVLKGLCNQLRGVRIQMERAVEVHVKPPEPTSTLTQPEMLYKSHVTLQDSVNSLLDSYQNYLSLLKKHYELPFHSFDELMPRLESHKLLFTGLTWYSTKVECVASILLCNVTERLNDVGYDPINMTDHRLRHRMKHLCKVGGVLERQLITWFGDVFSLLNRWNRLEQQIEDVNDQTLQLCNRLPGYPVNLVPRIEPTFAVWISGVAKRSQLSDTMETASCTARRLLISSDTMKNFRSQCEWIRDVTYQLWSLHPIASQLLTRLVKLYEELNLITKMPRPSSDLCWEPTSWNCVFQFNWARLICWTRNVLMELQHQADIIENGELSLNLLEKWLPFVQERLLAVHTTASNHEIDIGFLNEEFDRLDSLYLELIAEKGCQMEEIQRTLQWILGDLFTNNNGLLFDRFLDREQQLWYAYQSLKLQVEQRRQLTCQQFMHFVERLRDERTSTDQAQLQQTVCSFTRLFYVQYSKIQQYASESLTSCSLGELNKHLFHLTEVYIRLQTRLPVLLQLASIFNQTTSDRFRLFELVANWLNLINAINPLHQKLSNLTNEYQKLTSDVRQLNLEFTEFRRYSEFLSVGLNHTFFTCGLLEDSSRLHKPLTKWRSDLFKRLKVLKLSLLQLTSSNVVLRLNEPGTFSKTTDVTIHVVIKPRDLNNRIRELDGWLYTMKQQLYHQEKAILNTWHRWETIESALDRSEGELDFLIQSVSYFQPLPLTGNHSECPWNYLLRSVGRIKHLITDRIGCWRTYSEGEKGSASETVNEWSKSSEVYSRYVYIGGQLISYLKKIDRPTELIADVIQHIRSRLDTYSEIRTDLLKKVVTADKTLQQLLDQTLEFSRLCTLCHQSLSYCMQKLCRELMDKEPDIACLDTNSTVIPNEIPSLTRLVQLGFHQSVLADSSSKEGSLGQLNSLVNEITNTADSQTSAYFHSAVHSVVKSFYELYNLTTLSLTELQQKRSLWCYYELTFGELKLHSGYYSPTYNRNEYNTILSKLFTLRMELTTLALQMSSPSVLASMDTVLSNPSIVELMSRMQLNDFNDIAETGLQPEDEMIQINNGKWTLDSLARLCADQERLTHEVKILKALLWTALQDHKQPGWSILLDKVIWLLRVENQLFECNRTLDRTLTYWFAFVRRYSGLCSHIKWHTIRMLTPDREVHFAPHKANELEKISWASWCEFRLLGAIVDDLLDMDVCSQLLISPLTSEMQSGNLHDTCFANRSVKNITPMERLFSSWQSQEEYEIFIGQANKKCSHQMNELVGRLNQLSSDLSEIFMFLQQDVQPEGNMLMYQSRQLMKLWNSLTQLRIEWTALFWDGKSVDALGRSVQPNPLLHLSYDTKMELLSQTCLIANGRLGQLAKHSREILTSLEPSFHLIASITSEFHQRSDRFTRIAPGQSIFPDQSSCVEHCRPTDAINLNVIVRQVTFDLERWREVNHLDLVHLLERLRMLRKVYNDLCITQGHPSDNIKMDKKICKLQSDVRQLLLKGNSRAKHMALFKNDLLYLTKHLHSFHLQTDHFCCLSDLPLIRCHGELSVKMKTNLVHTVCSALQNGLKLQVVCTLARWHHRVCYPQPQTGHCNQLGDYLRARVHQLVSVLKTIQLNVRMTTQTLGDLQDLDERAQAWLENWGRTLNEVQMSRDGLESVLPEFNRELEDFLCLHGVNLPRVVSTNEIDPADAFRSACTDLCDRSFWTEDVSNRNAAFENRFVRTVERAQHMLEQGRRVLTVLEQNKVWLKQTHRLIETIGAQPSSPTKHVNVIPTYLWVNAHDRTLSLTWNPHNTIHILNDLCTELKCLEQRWIGVVWSASAADKISVHGLLTQMNSIRRQGESWYVQMDLLDADDTPTDTLDPLTSIVSFAPSAVRDAIQFGSSTPTDLVESSTWPSVAQLKLRNSQISVVESVSVHPIRYVNEFNVFHCINLLRELICCEHIGLNNQRFVTSLV
ncbi:hypothetical protein PHET_02029 [Paragonimus heterotremus]|uniref:Uncharacterized protein n=1 Tax=Paragonimus heterotremus TaxID=100268 RepID=A0A8J4TDL1_9TREM|nr:hypothetical protein PHET_02029 [Paragonimus heterotremus]